MQVTYEMGREGFEPSTSRLKAECSTAELPTHLEFFGLPIVAKDPDIGKVLGQSAPTH